MLERCRPSVDRCRAISALSTTCGDLSCCNGISTVLCSSSMRSLSSSSSNKYWRLGNSEAKLKSLLRLLCFPDRSAYITELHCEEQYRLLPPSIPIGSALPHLP